MDRLVEALWKTRILFLDQLALWKLFIEYDLMRYGLRKRPNITILLRIFYQIKMRYLYLYNAVFESCTS